MEDKIQALLNEEIAKEIKMVSALDIDSEEKSKAIDNLTQLYKLRIEEAKIGQESVKAREEQAMREKEFESKSWDRWINVGLQVGLAFAGFVAYDVWYRRGLRFEETGTITSPMTRNLLSRMLPRK